MRNKRKYKHVIDKGIDKAKGNTDEAFTEGRYQKGSTKMVRCWSLIPWLSNVNRTAANVRAAFGIKTVVKHGLCSVSTLFDNKGVIVFVGDDADAILELCLKQMLMWDDVEAEEGTITVHTAQLIFTKPIVALRESGVSTATELETILNQKLSCQVKIWNIWKLYSVLWRWRRRTKIYTNVDGS